MPPETPTACTCDTDISAALAALVAVTRAAERERIAKAIEAGVHPDHPNQGYRDGFARAAQIAREDQP